jgi:hypothetical protein
MLLFFVPLVISHVPAQTTQGMIRGEIVNLRDGHTVPGCRVVASNEGTGLRHSARSGSHGEYVLPLLSPGKYMLRVECGQFQSQELHRLELQVAEQLAIQIRMRPLGEVWEDQYRRSVFLPNQSVVVFYGPDVDTSRTGNFSGERGTPGALEATVSQVIDRRLLLGLPVAGRDAYTMLATQPGVTSDTTTTRSLGLSANGQRPTASQFLLDGLENNDALVTGPLSPLPPELIAEYRITTNNFSAEYGRTSGFLANAITVNGADAWHGIVYGYGRHHVFNANSFPRNTARRARLPERDFESGMSTSGRIRPIRLFVSGGVDIARLRSFGEEQTWTVPTPAFINSLRDGRIARELLTRFAPPSTNGSGMTGDVTLKPPISTNRLIFVPRADWASQDGKHRALVRLAVFRLERPDLVYSPYEGFNFPLNRNTQSIAVSWVSNPNANYVNDFRVGISVDRFSAERPNPDVPILGVATSVTLPGSTAAASFLNRTRGLEIGNNFNGVSRRHVWKIGGGLLPRYVDGYLSSYAVGRFDFRTLNDFARDAPASVNLSLARNQPLQPSLPEFDREYRLTDWYLFGQDSIRLGSHFTLSLGLRYDHFGAPHNVGLVKDHLLKWGSGSSRPDQIRGAELRQDGERVYEFGSGYPAVRLGVVYSIGSDVRTAIRAGYGMYRDRILDNAWQTVRVNSVRQLNSAVEPVPRNYLDLPVLLSSLPDLRVLSDFPEITSFGRDFRSPLIHSGMLGIQHLAHRRSLVLEADFLFSNSGTLLSTDRWNRQGSVPGSELADKSRFNNDLPNLLYRGNEGRANYRALTLISRQQTSRIIWQASYSLSLSRDNQSDPLLGDLYDLEFSGSPAPGNATFIRQFDPTSSWGYSDFDQRHNLVIFGLADLPGFLRGWQIGGLSAFRSGFPFAVIAPTTPATLPLLENPADVVDPSRIWADRQPVPGGVRLLNGDAFASAGSRVGNSRRNALHGPGFMNVDLAVSRRFLLRSLGEQGAIGFRIDAFNVINHANLSNPEARLGSDDFGIAFKGRTARPNAFRILGPLDETGRRIQFSVRLEF